MIEGLQVGASYDSFTPHDWYWVINNDESKVWSSKKGDFVTINDEDFQTFLSGGRAPSRIASLDELLNVLSQHPRAVDAKASLEKKLRKSTK